MGLFRFLFLLLLFYLIFKIIRQLLFPPARNQNFSFRDQEQNQSSRKYGETTINDIPDDSQKTKDQQKGDYIDYEEVE